MLRRNQRSGFCTRIRWAEWTSVLSHSRLFAGWRLATGVDHHNAGEDRNNEIEEESTFSGHSDESPLRDLDNGFNFALSQEPLLVY